MYSCTVHRGLDKKSFCVYHEIPEKLIVILLSPNVTSLYQTMDMGITTCFKVGYRVRLLEYLLRLFNVEEGYEALRTLRKRSKPGYKGLSVGRKPRLLDLMDLSVGIWNGDAKYTYKKTMIT